jgi:hypothetical protein
MDQFLLEIHTAARDGGRDALFVQPFRPLDLRPEAGQQVTLLAADADGDFVVQLDFRHQQFRVSARRLIIFSSGGRQR